MEEKAFIPGDFLESHLGSYKGCVLEVLANLRFTGTVRGNLYSPSQRPIMDCYFDSAFWHKVDKLSPEQKALIVRHRL